MNGKNIAIYLYIAVLLVAYAPVNTKTPPAIQKKQETWITIFVHGIMSIKPHINMNNFLRFMRDDVENTAYAKTVELMRQDPHFYKNQAMGDFGLQKIDHTKVGKGEASSAIAGILDDMLKLSNGPDMDNHFYTYGWTGLMSPTRRYKDAIGLYESIETEIAKFASNGITPKVRIIGYSHGGNVVLNLAAVRQKEPVRKDLFIDETILLGTPIQCETDYLINDQVFKKIYHVYSHGDRVQKLDFFSYDRFFSSRVFKERPGFKLPKKLIQIQLKLTRNTPATRANKKKIALTYNFNNPAIVSGKSHLLRDSSPGHAELWFMGWTPVHYRKDTFALNPLPAVALLPFILKTLHGIEDLLSPTNPVIIDMRPEHGVTLVKNIKNNEFYKVVDFIPAETFKKLQDKALPYVPDSYTLAEYDARIYHAYQVAYGFYQDEWSAKSKRRKRYEANQLLQEQKILALAAPPE